MDRPFELEAPSGIEPLHKGFADLSLTTWARRHDLHSPIVTNHVQGRNELERETGFEPATCCLGSNRSTTELLPQKCLWGSTLRNALPEIILAQRGPLCQDLEFP